MMFVGNNELHLNQATMILALQGWLNRNTIDVPVARVTGVELANGWFVVRLSDPLEKKP